MKTFLITASALSTVALADAVFKYLILAHPNTHIGNDLAHIALYKNMGIAFSLPVPHLIVIPITMAICAGFIWLTIKSTEEKTKIFAYAALVGSIGNLVDRIINGFTTDYLILLSRSAVNLSDLLILIGIAGLLWYHADTSAPQTR